MSELDVGDALDEVDCLHGGDEGGEGRGLRQHRVRHDRGCHEGYLRNDISSYFTNLKVDIKLFTSLGWDYTNPLILVRKQYLTPTNTRQVEEEIKYSCGQF